MAENPPAKAGLRNLWAKTPEDDLPKSNGGEQAQKQFVEGR
jgi:hypothetical protein